MTVAGDERSDVLPPALAATPPWGMGWVRHFVRIEPGLAPDAVYARQLYVGLSLLATPTFASGVVILPLIGVAFLNPILVVNLGLLVGGLLAWRRGLASFRVVVHAQLFAWWLAAFAAVVALGGPLHSGASAVWGLVAPIEGMLLLGRRAGLAWLLCWAAGMASAGAWAALDLPRGPNLPPGVLGALEANNLVQFGIFSVLAMNWFVEQRELAERAVQAERARSERILLKGMPRRVLERLRADERVADRLDEVSVLFSDVVGFTPLAATLDPVALLGMLDDLFRAFDEAIERHGLERVKTIGDCVMVVAGAPEPFPDHAERMARCALDLREVLERDAFGGHRLRLRIGIHCGPVVAGVIGRRRLAWDLWGDTVNLASRMESTGVAGAIHVSDAFRQRLGDAGSFEDRGEIEVKGKGRVRTWLLTGMSAPPAEERPNP